MRSPRARSSRTYVHNRPFGHGFTEPGTAPAKPRDAATLIVWRKTRSGVEVLMGRRSRRAKFIPDFFVFPGGRLDPLDHEVRAATPLDPVFLPGMAVRGNAALANALAVAAVRETFEETGFLLAAPGATGETHPDWETWRAQGLAPALHHLSYFGRAVTSPASPIRFNARFFIAPAEALQGDLGGCGELSDLGFYDAAAVIRDKPIVDVTEFMLKNLIEHAADPGRGIHATPLFAYRHTTPFVRYQPLRPGRA